MQPNGLKAYRGQAKALTILIKKGVFKMTEIKIWVGNLGKYNEGQLVGEWFTLPADMEEIKEAIGINEQYEEWFIADYEAPFKISEYANIEELNEIAEKLEGQEEETVKAAKAVFENGGHADNFAEAIDFVIEGNVNLYHENSMADIAQYWYEETGILAELENHPLGRYIDWEAAGRDMEIEGTFLEVEYGFWVEIIH